MAKVVARIKGGLGNQLFCYAAARRLASVNDAELVLDHVTGFARDRRYMRRYELDHFNIPCRKASRAERMEPLERYRRGVAKTVSRFLPFTLRRYIEQEGRDFDSRLLDFKVRGTIFLDGLWQSEAYFKDVESVIREELRIEKPGDRENRLMAQRMRSEQPVAVHMRWFVNAQAECGRSDNLSRGYYEKAIARMEEAVDSPHFFVFSDDPAAASSKFPLPKGRHTIVDINDNQRAYADLWLMSQARHFILANSTFSWWAAWLSNFSDKVVLAPGVRKGKKTSWGFRGQIPEHWIQL